MDLRRSVMELRFNIEYRFCRDDRRTQIPQSYNLRRLATDYSLNLARVLLLLARTAERNDTKRPRSLSHNTYRKLRSPTRRVSFGTD